MAQNPSELKTYKEAQEHQLAEWVAGRPWHNPFEPGDDTRHDGDLAYGECCPDFSCCQPQMLAPPATRQAFVNAGDETRHGMLGMFIGGMVADAAGEMKVHIAGTTNPKGKPDA